MNSVLDNKLKRIAGIQPDVEFVCNYSSYVVKVVKVENAKVTFSLVSHDEGLDFDELIGTEDTLPIENFDRFYIRSEHDTRKD